MPFATLPDGLRLYYETLGKGEPLLLIAGRNNDHHIWDMVVSDFTRRYQVIVYDACGTGQSDKPKEPPYSTPGFARDAIALLDYLEIKRAHIYGISMGGRVGQWVGIDYPERVGALILACSTVGDAHGVKRSPEVEALLAGGGSLKVLDTFFSRLWLFTHPQFFASMRESQRHPMPAYAEELHTHASESHDAWDRLPEIKAPTLVLHGSEDVITPAANAKILADRIPGAELHLIKGGRHIFFLEYRREVNKLVLDFLKRHPLNR